MLVPVTATLPNRRNTGRLLGGLRDTFNPTGSYTISQIPLDSVSARTMSPFLLPTVGTFQGMKVFQNPSSQKLFVWNQGNQDPDYGFVFYELIPVNMAVPQSVPQFPTPGMGAPISAADPNCPCASTNCKEEITQLTYWATPDQQSPDDIAIPMVQDTIECDPIEEKPVPACQAALEQLKATGVNGLRGLRDDSVVEAPMGYYTTDPNAHTFFAPPVTVIDKSNIKSEDSKMWYVVLLILAVIITALGVYAWNRRR